jgi:hypothetical protein
MLTSIVTRECKPPVSVGYSDQENHAQTGLTKL